MKLILEARGPRLLTITDDAISEDISHGSRYA